ncbi:von Willebrand factor A domain-containing protein 7 [Esox lucius]|uniref:von Willebrand factor A domain containing 7 n=1 Tax=Esox lucius TaxID=8010 RepID=A0A3P8Y8P4_ESOLU|nr:von Willebrand factor A domain-containing protein 7 [Esox lucius]
MMLQSWGHAVSVVRIKGLWVILCLVLALPGCKAFLPNFWSRVLTLSWDSYTHQYITEQAVLNVTLETLSMTNTQGQAGLGRGFWRAVGEVVQSNVAMDFLSSTRSDPIYHFDSERMEEAIAMLREFWDQTLLSARAKDYQGARHSLGQLLHSLQDFYSHSNWVETGQQSLYLHLLQPGQPAFPVATEGTPTCMECDSATCRDNLLPRLSQQHPLLLTTGYFGTYPPKPKGKCSHGGVLDFSRNQGATGGINKDSTSPLFSPHHYLHAEAAHLATMATLNVLRDLRDDVSPPVFLRLFSVKQPPALVFVMDTTGSMFEEITAARLRAFSIIQARANTPEQPGTFLMVPFHDPGVGPVYETDQPEEFMGYMENLMALGGGDEPEMCLTAILLALTHSPPLSEIFVFTDASPKDAHLYNAVLALTMEKQCKVNFLLTKDPSYELRGRRKRREALSPDRFSLYSSLSSVSGGLTVFTTNSDIQRVSAIIEDNTAADKVTLLHAEGDSTSELSHHFRVDSSVKNVTLHLTGDLKYCVVSSPTGHSQSLLSQQGPLAELEQFQGLYRIRLLSSIEPGLWHLHTIAQGPVTFNAIAYSRLDFLYYFAVETNGTHPGLARVEGSPITGVPTFLVMTVTGLSHNEEASFSHVTLLDANGESLQTVWLNSSSGFSSSGEELVGHMSSVPRVPFCVRLSGRDGGGNLLERVSTEMIQPTHVQIQILSVPRLVSGHSTTVHFDVQNHGPARPFTLTSDDDRGYLSQKGPLSFSVGERGSVRGEVKLQTPEGAEAGGSVTLTLTVRALNSLDSNYAVMHLTVVPPDPDLTPPSCSTMRVERTCPGSNQCTGASWTVSLAVTDRGGTALASIQLFEGQGALTLLHGSTDPAGDSLEERQNHRDRKRAGTTQGVNGNAEMGLRLVQGDSPLNVAQWTSGLAKPQPLWVRYTSPCCSPQAELLVWDGAGNVRSCHLTASQQRRMWDTSGETNRAGEMLGKSIFLLLLLLFCSLNCTVPL